MVAAEIGLGALSGDKDFSLWGISRVEGRTEDKLLGTGVTLVGTFEGLLQGTQGRFQGTAGIPGILPEEEAKEAEEALLYQREVGCFMDGVDAKLFWRGGAVHPDKVIVIVVSRTHFSTSGWRSA